ncbi:MAG: hypothetical protein JWM99_3977, partial [Verrucomicrobiales bacterium]|nr:hypothetical protein [Verrucomicrobiales bacterium]
QQAALEQSRPIPERLRALRLLTSHTEQIGFDWLRTVAADPEPEVRAWVPLAMSFRSQALDFGLLRLLANDEDPLVRRRVTECFTRRAISEAVPALIQLLGDTERVTRYPAMMALEHLPVDLWLNLAIASTNTQAALRGLVAGTTAGPVPANAVLQVVRKGREKTQGREDQLDLMRVIAIFKTDVSKSDELESTKQYLLNQLRSNDRDVRWESIRLCGEYEIGESVAPLLGLLAGETNHTTQFHIMQSLARISEGWGAFGETTVLDWLIANQQGWFAEFESKGVEFPLFWETTLGEFAEKHSPALIRNRSRIHLEGLLGTALIQVIAHGDEPFIGLQKVYRSTRDFNVKTKAVAAMHDLKDLRASEFARQEFTSMADPPLRREFVQIVAARPTQADVVLLGTALRSEDRDTLKAAIHGLTQLNGRLPQEILARLIQLLAARRELFWPVHTLLRTQGSIQSSADFLSHERAPDQTVQQATARSWKNWYAATFNMSFPEPTTGNKERSDEEVHAFIVASVKTPGDRTSGRKVYERLLCNSCHGGGETPGQEGKLFGPDLAGVMQRMNPTELADAIVYPSKQVADRFRASTIELVDGELITGFVTARDNESVTIADQQQVHRISIAHIRKLTSETGSLMPEHLLNALTSGEIRDLLAFLNRDVSPK